MNFRTKTVQDCGSTLQASWLPLDTNGLLIGIKDDRKEAGLAAILTTEKARTLADALQSESSTFISLPDEITLSVSFITEGIANRDGVDLTLCAGWDSITSIFLDKGDIGDTVRLINKGLMEYAQAA